MPRAAPGDATPHLSAGQERFIRAFAIFALAYSVYWIWWRWTETLNPDALWFSIPLVLAETYGFVMSLMLAFTVWRLEKRVPPPAPEGLSVDVFVTCYDEPLGVVRRTAMGAKQIAYPHKTWILDDGKREEIREMAEELGCGYIRREGNEHAKAGNLNNALKHTHGELILQLDADHVPLPHILDRLLGFFEDPKVAFVQSPQDFYNTDSFTYDVNEQARRIWEEQRIFFSVIQPGKDHWNAAFFCGSCGVIRRSALEEIGGFSVETITEDMETSLLLHARGWKSVYYGESLAYGLAPASAGAYHIQRLRWGQGSMQILRRFNPLTYPGLSLAQRICYLNSTTSYLDGFYKLVLYLSPVVFFVSGVLPIRAGDAEFLARLIPFIALHFAMFELLMRGTGYVFISERYSMVKFFTYMMAVTGYFAKGKLKFNVTPKGQGDVPFRTYAPQLVLMVVIAASVVWATLASKFGWVDYRVPGWGSLAFWANLVWAAYFFGFAGYVVHLSLYYKQQRHDERFPERLPIRLRPSDGADEGPGEVALTENLNPGGAAFRLMRPIEKGEHVEVTLPLTTGTVVARGEVLHRRTVDTPHGRVYVHGLQFEDLPVDDRDAIELHCMHHAVPFRRLHYREAFDIFHHALRFLYDARGGRRRRVGLPVRLYIGEGEEAVEEAGVALLEEISPGGALILSENPVSPGTRLRYEVPGTQVVGEGVSVVARALETPLGVRFAVGIKRDRKDPKRLPDATSGRGGRESPPSSRASDGAVPDGVGPGREDRGQEQTEVRDDGVESNRSGKSGAGARGGSGRRAGRHRRRRRRGRRR